MEYTVPGELARLKFILVKLYEVKTPEGALVIRDAGKAAVDRIAKLLNVEIPDTGFDQIGETAALCKGDACEHRRQPTQVVKVPFSVVVGRCACGAKTTSKLGVCWRCLGATT